MGELNLATILQSCYAHKITKGTTMLNEDVMKGKWKQVRGAIKAQWGKLTDDELEKTSGNLMSIAGIIQEKYGLKKEEVQDKLNSISAKYADQTNHLKKTI